MAEPVEMLFEMCTLVDTRKHALGGVHNPTRGGAILRARRGWLRTRPDTQSDSAVTEPVQCGC